MQVRSLNYLKMVSHENTGVHRIETELISELFMKTKYTIWTSKSSIGISSLDVPAWRVLTMFRPKKVFLFCCSKSNDKLLSVFDWDVNRSVCVRAVTFPSGSGIINKLHNSLYNQLLIVMNLTLDKYDHKKFPQYNLVWTRWSEIYSLF